MIHDIYFVVTKDMENHRQARDQQLVGIRKRENLRLEKFDSYHDKYKRS